MLMHLLVQLARHRMAHQRRLAIVGDLAFLRVDVQYNTVQYVALQLRLRHKSTVQVSGTAL
jgi:hypothetical protein